MVVHYSRVVDVINDVINITTSPPPLPPAVRSHTTPPPAVFVRKQTGDVRILMTTNKTKELPVMLKIVNKCVFVVVSKARLATALHCYVIFLYLLLLYDYMHSL